MSVIALNADSAFVVPGRGEPPDVGFWPGAVEPIRNEVEELAAEHCRKFPTDPAKLFAALVAFGLAIIALLRKRVAQDVDDGIVPPAP